MLQEMRKFSKSWIANIFLGILTLSFVSWGVGDILQGRVNTAVATVGDTPIEQAEFQRDYSNALRRAGEERGKALSADEARQENIGGQLLEEAINRTALDNVVHKLKLTVSDAMVTATIQSAPAFAGPTGVFDRQTFQQRISRLNYTEPGFIELIRSDAARNQLASAVENGFTIPRGYAQALFAYFMEMRAADYIVVDAKALGPIPPPPDSVLEAYVKAHANRFSTPEYRDVVYAWIAPDDVLAGITVTDEQIKTAYESHLDQYVTPAKRELQQIIFPSQAEANAAYAKITAGQTFEQAAAARGQKPSDINLGELVAADIEPAVGTEQAKTIFELPQGGMTKPLKTTAGGWALIRVSKLTPGTSKSLEQVKDELRQAIAQELAQSKLVDIANAYTDASSGGASLAEAAKKVGMHTARIVAMDASGLAPDGSKTAAPDDPDFRKLVFSSEVGEEGDPQPMKTGTYVVAVNGLVPPKLKPLDQVRTAALAAWTAEQRAILLQKKAQELAATATRDNSLGPVAKSIGATVQSSPALSRRTSDATFSSPALMSALFSAMPGQAVFGPKGTSGEFVVARVTGIVHPAISPGDPSYAQGLRLISGTVAAGLTESFTAAQRAKQGVKKDPKLLNSVMGTEGS
jgi:peptidyl-prolyl cis-trans isomerase D